MDVEGLISMSLRIGYTKGVTGKEGISLISCKNPCMRYYILSGLDCTLKTEMIVLYSEGANGFLVRPILLQNYRI